MSPTHPLVGLDHHTQRQLLDAARRAARQAHAPYSNFHVGAAILTHEGHVFTGCNIETARQSGQICAERNAVLAMTTAGEWLVHPDGKPIRAVAVSCIDAPVATSFLELANGSPCGACRQVIQEFSTPDTVIVLDNGADGIARFQHHDNLPLGFRFGADFPSHARVNAAQLTALLQGDADPARLADAARQISLNSYQGVTGLRSGATLQLADGSVFLGAGAANSSTSLSIHADRTVIHQAFQAGPPGQRPTIRSLDLFIDDANPRQTDWLQRGLDPELAHEFLSPDTRVRISTPGGSRETLWQNYFRTSAASARQPVP